RLHPDGPGAVQRDYDGGPMVTDVMHDETALRFARVLGERNEGFMQTAPATADGAHDFAYVEELAEVSGRPILYNVVQSFVRVPDAHRMQIAWLDSCRQPGVRVYGQGVTTTAALTFTFEDWNLFDDDPHWVEATLGTPAEPKRKLAHPARAAQLRPDESAHWRLSALPAHCAGFRDSGTLAIGAPADVVVYDYERLECLPAEVAYDFPGGEWRRIQRARGYRFVLVNGDVTIEDDRETGV